MINKDECIQRCLVILTTVCLMSCATKKHGVKEIPSSADITSLPVLGSLVTLTEVDNSGNRIDLTELEKVIDPNSTIILNFDRSKIIKVAGSEVVEDKALTLKLSKLKAMMVAEIRVITILNETVKAFESGDDSWKVKLASLGEFAGLVLDDEEGLEIYTSLTSNSGLEGEYRLLFRTAEIIVSRLEEQLLTKVNKSGTSIQFGGWINGKEGLRPIHITGFDDITPGTPFTVEQFQINLTQEQQDQVSEIAELAAKANQVGLSSTMNVKASIRNLVVEILSINEVGNIFALRTQVENLLQTSSSQLGALKNDLQDLKLKLATYQQFINANLAKYRSPESEAKPGELLIQINQDVDEIISKTNVLENEIKAFILASNSHFANIPGNLANDVQNISSSLTTSVASINNKIEVHKNMLVYALQTLIGAKDFASRVYSFTEKVRKISLENLPERASLSLESTGKREIGDKLIFKMTSHNSSGASKELYSSSHTLYFCTPFVRTAVGFLFTDPVPLGERDLDKSLFTYAPSYSILLKGFWKSPQNARKNLNYHRLYSPGVGINLSTLDYDNNGAMEVGVGGVFAIFNDFIQIGYGLNLSYGTGFSFFGLKIPVGSLAIR